MPSKVYKFVRIGLFKEQAEIVEKIQHEKGEMVSAVIRQLLTEYGAKYFPKEPGYVQIQKDRLELKKQTLEEVVSFKKMLPEDYAANVLKARVSKGHAWFCTGSTNPWPVPLTQIKELNLESKTVTDHLKILNNEPFFYNSGQEMSDADKKLSVKNWKKA